MDTRTEGADIEALERLHSRTQPGIMFGGVSLPPIKEIQVHRDVRTSPWNPPAGESTPEARLVAVSRAALSARIRQGVPLQELLGHFQTLALVEERLMSYDAD